MDVHRFSLMLLLTALAGTGMRNAAANGQFSPPYEPIDQAVEDTDELATSLRMQPLDLRQPMGFEQVYHVPGNSDMYMRVSGGIYAVFPRSMYVRGRDGTYPVIPPNTVFYIGEPAFFENSPAANHPSRVAGRLPHSFMPLGALAGSGDPNRALNNALPSHGGSRPDAMTTAREQSRSDSSSSDMMAVDDAVQAAREARRPKRDPAALMPSTVVNDPAYRARRVTELLQKAAAAGASN